MKCLDIYLYAVVLLSSSCVCLARVGDVGSTSKFYRALDKKPFAVALFFEAERARCNSSDSKAMVRDFGSLSNLPRYKEGDVQFIQANFVRNDLNSLKSEFSIDQVPAYLLFSGSLPLKDEGGMPVMLRGDATREQVQEFIEDNLQQDIDDRLADKAELREKRRQERLAYGPYFYFGYGYPVWNSWGYPYQYYPYAPCPYCW